MDHDKNIDVTPSFDHHAWYDLDQDKYHTISCCRRRRGKFSHGKGIISSLASRSWFSGLAGI
ncbi:hypothetical protein PFICI_07991 [Pestalotiopsis fici W106-1]|uniref:Uncharacterized protein n=1 Tax=Pestalotiopsis fici (strain W106-1 / CGMCC3.15140) TaxID=1229662 RepID=W3X4X8_PESFW|nr:uncharacterized protein PFICI_07991 [Pestalotiopsis fici W106-1]ETS80462.1 hypothetical protein PFICI_07991 [Pestalotiopsis fici W106-1]